MSGARVAVVGAGLAGLRCAQLLADQGHDITVFERGDAVGGRMRTDQVDGFRLDRGFHVMQTAYPAVRGLLDFEALGARAFEPGALVIDGRHGSPPLLQRLADPVRRPLQAPGSLLSGIAPVADLLRVGRLRHAVTRATAAECFDAPDATTADALRRLGFGPDLVERFFRPLFSGIFLESELRTPERFFRFIFRMMSQGDTVLLHDGIQAAPEALAERLGRERIRLRSDVEVLDERSLRVHGESLAFDQVVCAHPPAGVPPGRLERHVWTVHLDAPSSPLPSPHLLLNGELAAPGEVIAHLAVPSDVQPAWAPGDRSLVTVTVVGDRAEAAGLEEAGAVEAHVRRDLARWFGDAAGRWRSLAVQHVRHALPDLRAGEGLSAVPRPPGRGVIECGDHRHHGSVEGALRAAEAAVTEVRARLSRQQDPGPRPRHRR